ncbi:hypothetical protein AB0K60_02050 [Thermopolyspora sp. NPDC052614]|uniref:hypothetical protein n=1 Tax=Thermopolyspora sp. NPDC052614 TaxID=3155682 RepID=UPI0034221BC9
MSAARAAAVAGIATPVVIASAVRAAVEAGGAPLVVIVLAVRAAAVAGGAASVVIVMPTRAAAWLRSRRCPGSGTDRVGVRVTGKRVHG